MVDDDRYRQTAEGVHKPPDDVEVGEDLKVPLQRGNAACSRLQQVRNFADVAQAPACRIDTNATDAQPAHFAQFVRADAIVDNDDATGVFANLANPIDHATVVGSVGAGLHENHPLQADGRCHLPIIGERSRPRRIGSLARIGILLARSEHMHMTVAGARRRLEMRLAVRFFQVGAQRCENIWRPGTSTRARRMLPPWDSVM